MPISPTMMQDFKDVCKNATTAVSNQLSIATDYVSQHENEIKSYIPLCRKVAILAAGAFLFTTFPVLALTCTVVGYALETQGKVSVIANKIQNHVNNMQLSENEKIIAGISLCAITAVFLPFQIPAVIMGVMLGSQLEHIF